MKKKSDYPKASDNNKKSYTIGEIAEICQVAPTTVYRWVIDKKIPSFKTAGGHNRIWEADASTLFASLKISKPQTVLDAVAPKILIVDDNSTTRRLIRRLLQLNFPNAILLEAVDGYEAGFKTRDQKPQLVILDLNLPKIDGIKVCKMIKENKDLKQMRVLVVTGVNPERSKSVVAKAGADGFLAKPFQNDEFLKQVKLLLPGLD